MKNKLDKLFSEKKRGILNMYYTAGYPKLDSTAEVLKALADAGADIIEIGIPYSDPIADGPVIQQSNMQALENGMRIAVLFEQLNGFRYELQTPVILMGYMNPVLQFGVEKFCASAAAVGVDGVILPDLPMYEFESQYQPFFKKHNLRFIFLVTPETSEERIRQIDKLSSGFIYAVSSSSTTGSTAVVKDQAGYLKKLQNMKLNNPVLVGFGIKDKETFDAACGHSNGAIIGSAYINVLKNSDDIRQTTKEFINRVKGGAHLPISK
ncbi:MAG: tryptophan synthase subunit alpha [Chitinophagaceae bacterium]|nr:tryptophan synthase subunit alpha [Chitinophagaceae bacterium]